MRLRLGLVLVTCGWIGCAHKKPPPPPPPPTPKGDLLRFKANGGDKPGAKVALLIDQELGAAQGGKGGSRRVTLNFNFTEEETVDAVSPEGAASISARLVDVAGTATAGADQEQVDNFALALDELKIQFRRTPRGEVAAVTIAGVRTPLDEKTARMVLNALYGAARGALLPEEAVEVGATWNVQTAVPTPSGATADATYTYKYSSKDGTVAVVSGDGTVESKPAAGGGATKRMTGKDTAEYKLDLPTGRIVSSTVDVIRTIEESVPGQQTLQLGVRSHIHVGWESTTK